MTAKDTLNTVENTVEDAFEVAEMKAEDEYHNVEGEVEDYFMGNHHSHGGNSTAGAGGGSSGDGAGGIEAEFADTDATDCDYLMTQEVTTYWSVVGAMMALFVAAFVVPFLLCCCGKRWPRCASRWFFWLGITQWITGVVLATKLMPTCLVDLCGTQFCSAHKYNPGQVWGGVVVGLGFILQCKACALWRVAKKQQNERNLAMEAEKGALVSQIDTMMDESQRGSHTNGIYKDRPDDDDNDKGFPDSASSQFPDRLL